MGVEGKRDPNVSTREGFDYSLSEAGRRNGSKTLGEVSPATEVTILMSIQYVGEKESPGVLWWPLVKQRCQ